MGKRLLILGLCLALILLCVGCSDSEFNTSNVDTNYFNIIEQHSDSLGESTIVYAKDTKVMYYIYVNYSHYGITPLYNADGTLQIYNEGVE